MINSIQLAKAIVGRANDKGIKIDQLKLQKLAYYCQGHALALTGEPLFDEKIEAWDYGPVVPAIYHEFKAFGAFPIPVDTSSEKIELGLLPSKILDFVIDKFGQCGSWSLVQKTHQESPWMVHYNPASGADSLEITRTELLDFFAKEAEQLQDSVFASLLDANNQLVVELPSTINSADDFYNWLQDA